MGIRLREQASMHALLTDYDPGSAYCEAFQTLYANIRTSWESGRMQLSRVHTLLVTTAATSPEHTFVAANLAIVAAQANVPTLLVDAELRTPRLQQSFGVTGESGLSNLLTENAITPAKVAACLKPTFVTNLRLLAAGTLIAREQTLLASSRLSEIMMSLRELVEGSEGRPGLIVFHTPPVLAGADASIVGSLVEQTFLGIVPGRTTRKQAKDAQEQLLRSHADLSGIIMLNT